MMKLLRNQSGDTIVEVLIAMAVISLVLVGAYISTNSNIATTQDAQERGQAVELLQTEVEYLRKADLGSFPSGGCFVIASSNPPLPGIPIAGGGTPDGCTVTSDGKMAASGAEPAYTLKITSSGGTYALSATWDSLTLGNTKANITLYYQP